MSQKKFNRRKEGDVPRLNASIIDFGKTDVLKTRRLDRNMVKFIPKKSNSLLLTQTPFNKYRT